MKSNNDDSNDNVKMILMMNDNGVNVINDNGGNEIMKMKIVMMVMKKW